ncbi:MAG: LacI family transcriptional regulator [Cellvibrionaceae bacterium]|jgi:LacI family transcriptional regulator
MAVTLKDISDKVGKSVPTVSRALAGFDDISPKTRDTIQAVAKEMGYVPNNFARKLQSQKADAVGLILPGAENLRILLAKSCWCQGCKSRRSSLSSWELIKPSY